MITIINYDREPAARLKSYLDELGVESKLATSESIICSGSKIIMPETKNVVTALKKIQLMNLFNLLKIISKPLLGIGEGVIFMCDRFPDTDISCLSFFKNTGTTSLNVENNNANRISKLSVLKHSPLFEGIGIDDGFLFDASLGLNITDDTLASCTIDGREYSAVLQNNNYYGFLFDPLGSGINGKKLLSNFCLL